MIQRGSEFDNPITNIIQLLSIVGKTYIEFYFSRKGKERIVFGDLDNLRYFNLFFCLKKQKIVYTHTHTFKHRQNEDLIFIHCKCMAID